MKKILITLAALAAVSGSALAGQFEKSDSEAPIMGRNAVLVEQASLSAPSNILDGDTLRGGSNNSFSK